MEVVSVYGNVPNLSLLMTAIETVKTKRENPKMMDGMTYTQSTFLVDLMMQHCKTNRTDTLESIDHG